MSRALNFVINHPSELKYFRRFRLIIFNFSSWHSLLMMFVLASETIIIIQYSNMSFLLHFTTSKTGYSIFLIIIIKIVVSILNLSNLRLNIRYSIWIVIYLPLLFPM